MRDLGLDKASEVDLARTVFQEIDADGSGAIGVDEIRALLRSWGLPPSEAHEVMARADEDGDGVIEFEEFRSKMRPVWVFGAKVMGATRSTRGFSRREWRDSSGSTGFSIPPFAHAVFKAAAPAQAHSGCAAQKRVSRVRAHSHTERKA